MTILEVLEALTNVNEDSFWKLLKGIHHNEGLSYINNIYSPDLMILKRNNKVWVRREFFIWEKMLIQHKRRFKKRFWWTLIGSRKILVYITLNLKVWDFLRCPRKKLSAVLYFLEYNSWHSEGWCVKSISLSLTLNKNAFKKQLCQSSALLV